MRTLGNHGPSVSDVGLGCMEMSDLYGPADDTESIATIHVEPRLAPPAHDPIPALPLALRF